MGEKSEQYHKEIEGFKPPEEFARNANVNDPEVYVKAENDPETFWEENARELHWYQEWDKVLGMGTTSL
ncbi:MAG: acetyl-coenzyme A synthetase N-terminal domain-containing protein [Methanolobus sp.]